MYFVALMFGTLVIDWQGWGLAFQSIFAGVGKDGTIIFSVQQLFSKNVLFLLGGHFRGSLIKESRLLLGFILSVPIVVLGLPVSSVASLEYKRQK